MSEKLEKLKRLISELFMLDQADLDFGIYRIMNQKRDDITRFLDNDLLPQVKAAFEEYQDSDLSLIKQELNEAIEQAKSLGGVDPEDTDKVKKLRAKMAGAFDITKLENEVYSDLYNFFRRYYHGGDFLSLRRYKEGVYSIPYSGEEVMLHWANKDQYYIKTSEYFRDYTFKLSNGKRVHFKLIEADTEKDNMKASNGNDRRFILCEDDPLYEENDELYIRFEYRPDDEKRKQKNLNEKAVETILSTQGFSEWSTFLSDKMPTEKNPDRTVLEKYLTDYTARNEFDYFIHKDLGGFLRRELDFFIKNEIMHLDDIEHETAPRVEQYLSKIKVIRKIAHKIITFLESLENFQKKLWLKKKFVVETNYCVTLDRVPEELYPEIAANDAQREEWVRLFAIDEIKGDLATEGFSEPLTIKFLKENKYLVLDTKIFNTKFINMFLASVYDVSKKCNGLLVRSENSQALRLLQDKHHSNIECIYIDPPFNTAATQILYKNDYRHSSWLSLINERLYNALPMMKDEGIICVAIDDFELPVLTQSLSEIFGEENHLATVPVRSNPHGRAMAAGFSTNHEYALFYAKTKRSVVGRLPRDERRNARYPESDEKGTFTWINFRKTGAGSARIDRPKLYYPIFISKDGVIRISSMEWSNTQRKWVPITPHKPDETIIYPMDSEGNERVWNMGWERAQKEAASNLITKIVGDGWQIYRKYYANQDGALPGTWWDDAKYSATESGTSVVKSMLCEREIFSYPKSIHLVEDCLRASNCTKESSIVDFFAGSGTTAHAVINLNRKDDGNRKYILVEMGEHFDTVLKPRIMKAIYSKDWKGGKPVSREGSSHMFKYIRLESYEDATNNLEMKRSEEQELVLEEHPGVREDYILSYMLDVESAGSASLLNIDSFEDPFNYKMKISTGSVGETKLQTIDLVETFNYLIGLTVQHIDFIRGFRVVQGTNPDGEKVLIIWRNLKEKSNEDLDKFFRKQEYNPKDMEFDLIYVNGDNNLENLRRQDETWKVRLIESEFQRLMFDVEDI